jgi:hypothetical protein
LRWRKAKTFFFARRLFIAPRPLTNQSSQAYCFAAQKLSTLNFAEICTVTLSRLAYEKQPAPLEVFMKKSLLFVLFLLLTSSFGNAVLAQDQPNQRPPGILYIVREEIKPGMMDAHNQHSASFARIFRSLEMRNHRIALVPVAGNENEVVYITGANTFQELESILNDTDKRMGSMSGATRAELERLNKEAPALHAAMRDTIARYRPELSFNPNVDIRQMRYFAITTTRVRPGHDAQYADYVQKIVNTARQKAKADNLHIATFQVITGTMAGTYLSFRPLKSLAEYDDQIAVRVRAAMSEDARKDADRAASDAIMSSDVSTYRFEPNMSYVEKEFAAGDPSFWNPKPMAAPKPKPRKPAKPAAPVAPTQ